MICCLTFCYRGFGMCTEPFGIKIGCMDSSDSGLPRFYFGKPFCCLASLCIICMKIVNSWKEVRGVREFVGLISAFHIAGKRARLLLNSSHLPNLSTPSSLCMPTRSFPPHRSPTRPSHPSTSSPNSSHSRSSLLSSSSSPKFPLSSTPALQPQMADTLLRTSFHSV